MNLAKSFFSRNRIDVLVLILGVMAFRAVLSQCGAVNGVKADLIHYNVPVLLIALLLPLLSGIVLGFMFAIIASSFPLIIPLVMQSSLAPQAEFCFLFAFAAAFLGMMLSPVHACLLFTKQHFGATFPAVYRNLIPLYLCWGLFASAYFFMLLKFG